MIGRLFFLLSLFGMCMVCAQRSSAPSLDSLQGLGYDALFDKIKGAGADSTKQGVYLKAYLDKARSERNWGEMVQGYKNYLHRSEGGAKLTYADSMVGTAKSARDSGLIGSAYLTKGIVFYSAKQYKAALDNYLLADQFLAGSDDAYLQFKLKYNIALVKYYTEHFDEAIVLLNACRDYFKGKSIPGYLNTLLLLGRCHQRMKNYGLGHAINAKGMSEGKRLGNTALALYFVQSEGINHAMEGNYPLAIDLLDSSQQFIRAKGNDFANEVLGEFYLGKSYWGLGQREKAVEYFKQVDASFSEKGYMKTELLGAYTHLTEYYADLGNQELRLLYLNKHIGAINFMGAQNHYLDDRIKDGYDLKGVQREKQRIERLLRVRERQKSMVIAAAIFLVVLLLGVAYKKERDRSIYQKRFEEILKGQNPPLEKPNKPHLVPSHSLDISQEKIDGVLARLERFEGKQEFLDRKMSASKLAVIAEVNGKYLSQIMAHYKGKRVMEYINDLRVDHIIEQMKEDRKLAYYSNGSLAEVAGFNSERTFVNAFRARVGITPMFFIQRLKAKGVPE
ncbi:AraC family transcriptional regulator [Flagellimonas hadalis]|uniref:AraC family transcriptional regulator n=1 Tax=Flagellimonas hadalis TaxID=2597517 RepID=A0A5N5J048_9FLAO|nr:AraC family transcriptional regulator [Allomuricauda hadalis]KAB5484213.1 AraC family transcriptional regulator [Allomuricauda hadalis]